MAQLAIKGHKDRGEEVIALLEILGGSNAYRYIGNNLCAVYYIDEKYKNYIICSDAKKVCDCIIFNLEEFLEKFPYKVGDKVIDMNDLHGTITAMSWDEDNDTVLYTFKCDEVGTNRCGYTATMLKPYKKEISGVIIDRFICLEGFEFYDDKGNIIDTKEITMMKKKPQYPKTYEDCLKILGYNIAHTIPMNHGHNGLLLMKLQRLIICRDAYWKIAGKQMVLGKPWEPDYDSGVNKYGIICMNGVVQKSNPTTNWERHLNKVLDFPTEEMRDAFYENFKELIEECKELL